MNKETIPHEILKLSREYSIIKLRLIFTVFIKLAKLSPAVKTVPT